MKFWKILRNLIDETLPDWQDKFLAYKDLKQHLNLIYPIRDSSENLQTTSVIFNHNDQRRVNKRPRSGIGQRDGGRSGGGGSADHHEVTTDDFRKLLEEEINKFNKFFMDKEEEYIITLQMLKDEVAKAKEYSEVKLMKVGRQMVDFHGEMILLENYSALNYTGLVKILKKHDKRSTGHLIQLPFIQKVLQEPFFRTEVIKKLVKECEIMIIYHIFSRHQQQDHNIPTEDTPVGDEEESSTDQNLRSLPEELSEIECMENMYLKLTISALRTLKKIRNGSSTASLFSMPPMEDCDDLD